MKTATCHLTGITPYSSSRPFSSDLNKGESHDAFDRRAWREHMTLADDGTVIIPMMAFKMGISAASKLTQRKFKGNQTYSKIMETGILLDAPLRLEMKPDDKRIKGEKFYCSSTGQRGGSSRVWRTYPMIFPWSGTIKCYMINPVIEMSIFEDYLREAGQFIGVGRFRPERGGVNGRWNVNSVKWSET